MPEDVEGANDNEEENEAAMKRSQILSEFRALSYEEQMNQRIRWAQIWSDSLIWTKKQLELEYSPSPQKLHYGAIFQPAIPQTWQECFYATLYKANRFVQSKLAAYKRVGLISDHYYCTYMASVGTTSELAKWTG